MSFSTSYKNIRLGASEVSETEMGADRPDGERWQAELDMAFEAERDRVFLVYP